MKYWLIISFLAIAVCADTPLKSLRGNIVLKKSESPYWVDADLVQTRNDQLKVEPGVEIIIKSYAKILLQGKSTFKGTKQEPIKIYPSDKNLGWVGLHLAGGDQNFLIEHLELSGAFKNSITTASGVIEQSKIYDNHYGLWLDQADRIVLDDCNVYQNRYGIAVVGGELKVKNSLIEKNSFGVLLEISGKIKTTDTKIAGNLLDDQMQEIISPSSVSKEVRRAIEAKF